MVPTFESPFRGENSGVVAEGSFRFPPPHVLIPTLGGGTTEMVKTPFAAEGSFKVNFLRNLTDFLPFRGGLGGGGLSDLLRNQEHPHPPPLLLHHMERWNVHEE